IGGSLRGGTGSDSGEVTVIGNIGPIKIGRDFVGGSVGGTASNFNTGYIQSLGRIVSITVGGSIISGIDASTGTLATSAAIHAARDIGSLTVRGSLIGNINAGAVSPVVISASRQATPGALDLAIGKITIGGRVERAQILAGYSISLVADNGNASVGPVSVGGNWIASDLVAGVQDDASAALNASFGEADDLVVPGFGGAPVATIVSVSIKGLVLGTAATGDHFGFVAQQIGSFKSLKSFASLTPLTAITDVPIELALLSGDVTIREVP
ncbi:MAG: hypothetical protein WCF18_21395, partial [Chthoniobacteraceae bacterium]